MEPRHYSDYTAVTWPWPRKRSPSAELASIFTDQASLKGAVPRNGDGNGKEKTKNKKPAHPAKK